MHADADLMSAPPAVAPQQACSTQITSSSGAKSDHSASRYYAAFLAFVLVFSSALGCFHVHLVLEAAATITVTFDETAHVGAGVTFWKYKDFRLNPENGVLPQLIAGGGVILGRAGAEYSIPTFQQQAWRYSDCWTFGFQLLHESGNDLRSILHDGRRGIAVCSGAMVFATGVIAYFAFLSISPSRCMSSFAASVIAAFVACTLCALDPSLIAHGGLMTSDTVLTLFWLVAPVLLWNAIVGSPAPKIKNSSAQLHSASNPSLFRRLISFLFCLLRLLATGAVTGLLIASKHSGVLIAPVLIAFVVILARFYTLSCGIVAALMWMVRAAAALAVVTLSALVVFWGCYFFRFSAFADGDVGGNDMWLGLWNNVDYMPQDGIVKQVLLLLRHFQALPQAFQYGFAYAYKSALARNAFLMGSHSAGGWKSFFPIAVAIKTPIAALALLAASCCLLLLRVFFRLGTYPESSRCSVSTAKPSLFPALIVPFCVYWGVAIHTNLNIGHRHMLPSYPPMFIFAAYCVFMPLVAPQGPRFVRVLIRTLAFAVAIASLAALVWEVQPNWLTPIPFFNLFVGGPSQGYKYLVDSSLDWGQDLPRFSALVNETRASEIAAGRDTPLFYLSYFGWGHPPSHGLVDSHGIVYVHSSVSGTASMPRHVRSLTVHMEGSDNRRKVYLAVGASIFQGVYNSIATGPWNPWFELQYRRMRRCVKRLHSSGESDFMKVMAALPRFKEFALNYDGYRLARMCAGLRNVDPDFNVGNSILVFELDRKRLRALLDGPSPAEVGIGDMPYLTTSVEMP